MPGPREVIEGVLRATHEQRSSMGDDYCPTCLTDYPCPTALLLDALDATEAETDRLREDAATFERMFREALDGKRKAEAEVGRHLAGREIERGMLWGAADRVREAEAAVARVRALSEDEWGPLSDDVERCALCRRKWSKHGDDDADHPAVSSALVAYVIDLRDALDGGDDDD